MSQIWKTQQRPQDWKRSILIPIPKKSSTTECSKHQTTTLISHASKVMLKILHAKLQHYANQELPDIQAGFRKCRGTRGQLSTFTGSQRKQGNSRKTSTSDSLTMLKTLYGSQHTRPPYLSPKEPLCKSRINRTRHGTMDCY